MKKKLIRFIRKVNSYLLRDVTNEITYELEARCLDLQLQIDKLREEKIEAEKTSAIYDYSFYSVGNKRYRAYLTGLYTLQPLVKRLGIKSVVDFGCGVGGWLCAAKKLGIHDVLGIDGDYVNRDYLMIENQEFLATNLEKEVSLERKFDLAVSIEVAEHLHEEFADTFIDSICKSADLVFFSACQPGENGPNVDINHFNEQPIEYWEKKFNDRGYQRLDLRKYYTKLDEDLQMHSKHRISLWVRLNSSLYVKNERYDDTILKLKDIIRD